MTSYSDTNLGVLRGDLEDQGQSVVVKVLIQSQQGTMHATLMQVPRIVPKPNRLDPVNHLVIGPDQHIWRAGEEKGQNETGELAEAPRDRNRAP